MNGHFHLLGVGSVGLKLMRCDMIPDTGTVFHGKANPLYNENSCTNNRCPIKVLWASSFCRVLLSLSHKLLWTGVRISG